VKYRQGRKGSEVNIQIFGTKKSQDTRKVERFFKERGIRYQFVDVNHPTHSF
jgi:arsenate reductase-like glutaredoxin family protein